jgi:hypothetical protein
MELTDVNVFVILLISISATSLCYGSTVLFL